MKKTYLIITLVVIALAAVFWGRGKVNSPTVSPTVSPEAINTTPTFVPETTDSVPAGWQTYRNEQYGFEFQYPQGTSVSEKRAGVFVIESINPIYTPTLAVTPNSGRITLQGKMNELRKDPSTILTSITLGGTPAVLVSSNENGGTYRLVVADNYVYEFSGIWSSDVNNKASTAQDLLNTFKFTK